MKEIKLIPDVPFKNSVDVAVVDFPASGKERQRCKITVDFSPYDVKHLQDRGMSLKDAMEYYKKRVYDVVKYHISQDWQCVGGYEEVMGIIEKRIKEYF